MYPNDDMPILCWFILKNHALAITTTAVDDHSLFHFTWLCFSKGKGESSAPMITMAQSILTLSRRCKMQSWASNIGNFLPETNETLNYNFKKLKIHIKICTNYQVNLRHETPSPFLSHCLYGMWAPCV